MFTLHAAAGPTRHERDPVSPLIHLIDDDQAVRDSLALLIGTVGLRVQAWADPQAFLRGFDREGIGAIVLDVRMPGIGGWRCWTGWWRRASTSR